MASLQWNIRGVNTEQITNEIARLEQSSPTFRNLEDMALASGITTIEVTMGAGMLKDWVADTWSLNSTTRGIRLASDLTGTFGPGGRQITIGEEIAHELAHAVVPDELKQRGTIDYNPNRAPEELWVRRRTGAVADDLRLPRPNNADSPLSNAIKINPEQSCTPQNPQGNGLSDGVLFLDGTRGYNGIGSTLPPGAGSVDPGRLKRLEPGDFKIDRFDDKSGQVVQSGIVGPDGSRSTIGFDGNGNQIWSVNQAGDGLATPIAGNGNNVTTDDGGAPGALGGRLGSLLLNPTNGGSAFPAPGDLLGSLQRSLLYSGGSPVPVSGGLLNSLQSGLLYSGGSRPVSGRPFDWLQPAPTGYGIAPAPGGPFGFLQQNPADAGASTLGGPFQDLQRSQSDDGSTLPASAPQTQTPSDELPTLWNGVLIPPALREVAAWARRTAPQPEPNPGTALAPAQAQMTPQELPALWNGFPIPPALREVAAWASRTAPQPNPADVPGTALTGAPGQIAPQQVSAPGQQSPESLLPAELRPLVRFFGLDDS